MAVTPDSATVRWLTAGIEKRGWPIRRYRTAGSNHAERLSTIGDPRVYSNGCDCHVRFGV